nr:hypothetical protein [Luteipulveratus mongoliensis]
MLLVKGSEVAELIHHHGVEAGPTGQCSCVQNDFVRHGIARAEVSLSFGPPFGDCVRVGEAHCSGHCSCVCRHLQESRDRRHLVLLQSFDPALNSANFALSPARSSRSHDPRPTELSTSGGACKKFCPHFFGHAVEVQQERQLVQGCTESPRLDSRQLRLRPADRAGDL